MDEKIRMNDRFKWSLNPKKYIYLIKDKISKAFLYLFIIAAIFGGIQGITSIITMSTIEDAVSQAYDEGKLNFEMKNGILSFESSPYKQEQGSMLMLIDTDKTVDEIDSLRSITVHKDLSTVILSDGIVVKNGSNQTIYKFSDLGLDKINFDNEVIDIFIKEISIIKYLMIPIFIAAKYVDLLLYSLLMSVAGMISIALNRQKLSYADVFKLSMYSMTIPSLISLILPIGKYAMFIGGLVLIFGINYIIYDDIIVKRN